MILIYEMIKIYSSPMYLAGILSTSNSGDNHTDYKAPEYFGIVILTIPASTSSNLWRVWSVYRITTPENFPSVM